MNLEIRIKKKKKKEKKKNAKFRIIEGKIMREMQCLSKKEKQLLPKRIKEKKKNKKKKRSRKQNKKYALFNRVLRPIYQATPSCQRRRKGTEVSNQALL